MSEKTKIDIALLLPTVPDARDACVQRLSELLRAKEGIETAHLAETKDKGHESICIHYDPCHAGRFLHIGKLTLFGPHVDCG